MRLYIVYIFQLLNPVAPLIIVIKKSTSIRFIMDMRSFLNVYYNYESLSTYNHRGM